MQNRYFELDSLRGLAALSVLVGHMYAMFPKTFASDIIFEFGILRILVAGTEAVTLFFVLSGFVLALPFYSNRYTGYPAYMIKRFCRIYIPYIVAIIIAIILKELTYSGEIKNLSGWFNNNWYKEISVNTIIEHVLLIGTFGSNLDNVVWSLVHEMRVSIVFPIFMLFLIKFRWFQGLLFAFGLSLVSVFYYMLFSPTFNGTELYSTVHYSALFVVGALIAKYRYLILNKVQQLNNKGKSFLFSFGFITYVYVHPSFILNKIIEIPPFYRTVIDSWFITLGASILIILALSSGYFSKVLNNRIVKFSGEISYSMYLIHVPIILALVHLLNGIIPVWVICGISVLIVIIIAYFMHKYVEKPAMRFGKQMEKSINRRTEKVKLTRTI